jgi:hypothetical protein
MLNGIYEVTPETLKTLYKFNIESGRNLMTFGSAGIGKTQMAEQAAQEMGYDVLYLNLSVLEAPDLMGLPEVKDGKAVYALPHNFPREDDDNAKPVVLLVDEIDKAKPELQNPMLELFQSRTINGTKLKIKAILATGNLPDEGAFSLPVSHALTNRCKVYKVVSDFDSWIGWAQGRVNSLVVAFLMRNQEFLLRPPPSDDDTAYAHPSPRAWTNAAMDLDDAENTDIEFKTMLVSGYCGMEAATKFRVWIDYYQHVEKHVDQLVKNGTFPPSDLSVDHQLVCAVSSLTQVVKLARKEMKDMKEPEKKKMVKESLARVCKWLKELPSEHKTVAIKSSMDTKDLDEGGTNIMGKYEFVRVPEFTAVIRECSALFNKK